MNRISQVTWERNGNFEDDECGTPAMDKSPLPLSSCSKFTFHNSDLNSNQILNSDSEKDEKQTSQESHCYSGSSPNHNKTAHREKHLTLNSPTSVFTASLHQKDLSYDDLSKNIDANLAEIDMETFRSEDINSILALPAIYSGQFDSVNHGEQCASVSGSLLNGLEIETSVSNRISEDEISICKDEPLFSPQREPPTHERTISVDSLDNSSSYDQDLVLTCKANKNNYTIVFEGSETQFSEDSEYHNGLRSSEVVSSTSEDVNTDTSYTSNSMIQSDLVFTTWSNLKRTHLGKSRKKFLHDISIKSKSLPNLSYQSALFNDKVLQWAKLRGNKNSVFPDLDLYHPNGLQVMRKCGYPYTLSLVKLFMKYKVSSRSSVFSSEHSNSTNSLIVHSLSNINHSSQNIPSKTETKEYKGNDADLANQNYNIKNQISLENLNSNQKRQLFVDNIRILDWHPEQNIVESNNNTGSLKSFPTSSNKLHNTNNLKDVNAASPIGECDNSQYFEDSLMEAPILQVKNFNAMPIKEEEETDISSGDEIMKTSMSSDCNNCSSSSIDAAMIKNNTLDLVSNAARQDVDHNLERIINIFPSCKTNVATTSGQALNDGQAQNKDLLQDNQATQTKQYNSKNCINIDVPVPCPEVPKTTTRQMQSEHSARRSSGSRDTSPNSSGYISSRHSSVERQQRSSVGSSVDVSSKPSLVTKIKNVFVTTTRSCSTQVPVHVKDVAMQTSTLASSGNSNTGFLFRNSSGDDISETEYAMEQSARANKDTCNTSNKPLAKEDKCIYVCFPNYSLPDLSFLKSVSSEGSNSVFLSPTKFKPPQKAIHTHVSRPKSSEGLDSHSRKRLSNIKDWESLSVLLPDDLKHLLSEMHLKDGKYESSSARHGLTESKSFPSSKTVDNAECLDSEGKKPTANFLRHCSFNLRNRSHLSKCHSPSSSFKEVKQEGAKMKLQPSRACSCQQCIIDTIESSGMHSKGSCKLPTSQNFLPKDLPCRNIYEEPVFTAFKPENYSSQTPKPEQIHTCSKHIFQKHFAPVNDQNELKVASGYGFKDQSTGAFQENKKIQHPGELIIPSEQHSAYTTFKTSHKCKNIPVLSSSKGSILRNVRDVENAVCQTAAYCDASFKHEKKSPPAELDYSTVQSGKDQRHKDCDNVNSDFFEMEKAPQEFLVSPVQISSDSYQVHTSLSGGSTVFHESLKRKTGLVENLQKAATLIYEDHSKNFRHGASCCTSFSVGQKILTSLCPALHTILSDGLLPSVQGFFGPLPNSPWKVTEACVQLEESKKEVQELLKHVNSEKLLTDSTYRFNAFIMGLLNLGCLEWWLGHLLSSRSLISHHYHPTALLSLLSLPASAHLQQELMELVSPLTNLSFNLDLAFETRIAAAKAHDKYNSNCCTANKNELPDDHIQNKLPNFAFCLSHEEQQKNCNTIDLKHKSNANALGLLNASCKGDGQDHPVWPGITINPFPNIQVPKELNQADALKHIDPKHPDSAKYECMQKVYSGLKEKRCKKRVTDLSLCSSIDSGCSSQVCHSHVISSVATDSGESENHVSSKQDGHQFRKLQQKWEKITHGMDKQQHPKNSPVASPSLTQNNGNNANKKSVEISIKKASRCQLRVTTNCDTPRNAKTVTVKRAVSQPPSGKPHSRVHPEVSYERKLQTPDVIASSKISSERKNRSQIPMLKATKSLQPKSKIPIQKSGMRTQSANRDSRNLS